MQPLSVVRSRIPDLPVKLGAGMVAGSLLVWSSVASAALPVEGFADLAEKVSPAVVNVQSTQNVSASAAGERENNNIPFPEGSPLEKFFRQFQDQFGQNMPQQHRAPVRGLGSGFIIDPAGYVVTNNHVVENASELKVNLSDGRSFDAKIVGTDPKTDLALLRIKADKDLPYVSFGDSGKVRVGEPVLAVGNPFGLGGTVTAGIISATGRNINAGPYDDFIQTDAAINRGNSGGPMFNTDGEVIGINTAIFSPTGGSIGIGFAIPSDVAKNVIAQLKEKGSVERGWLGVQIQQVTPDIAEAMGLDHPHGALVASVVPDSPAAKAGLHQGDVILRFGAADVEEMRDLPKMVAAWPAGKEARVAILRDGERITRNVDIARLEADQVAALDGSAGNGADLQSDRLGATLSSLTDDVRQQLDLPESVQGVVVSDVDPAGPAAQNGMRPGDVIQKVDGRKVAAPGDVASAISKADAKKPVLLLVNRGGNELFVGVRLKDA